MEGTAWRLHDVAESMMRNEDTSLRTTTKMPQGGVLWVFALREWVWRFRRLAEGERRVDLACEWPIVPGRC